ncbi:MAG: hypothetical protein CML13_04715 [Puniceicoccaceae bacterium]|nr:hypothetical protein [Puniceicoccaceae bacterium]|tara:strand:+ start:346 stop:594 length:249 start_codon:yes stop_codon:yes gene_type:complete
MSELCAYKHLYRTLSTLVRGGEMTEPVRAGRNIALLGIFCPIFWFALFSGANASTLKLHAAHSGIVFLTGLTILMIGLIKKE